ncbi:9662_t:CDS:2 [Paraglomus occultum]|uniref:9662_t:CDS:1 n=1 Tax=Paraglomus occultum TaxID=144539 RepID=A0A9N9BN32_9GLOM|nr:9662_t:CDS:2 [Paraglomus occultum]
MRVVEYANEPLRALWISYDRKPGCGANENDKARPTIVDPKKDDETKMQTEEIVDDEQINSDDDEKFSCRNSWPLVEDLQRRWPRMNRLILDCIRSLLAQKLLMITRTYASWEKRLWGCQGAYNAKDPEKELVILKFVFKSRILVDSGYIMKYSEIFRQIRILHTLRQLSHPNIVHMIACAVGHLHKNDVAHGDVKKQECYLDEDGNRRLIDFASAAYIQEGKQDNKFRGTLDYAAPEMLTSREYDGLPQDIRVLLSYI